MVRWPCIWTILLLLLLAGCSPGRGIEAALILGEAAGWEVYGRFSPEPRRSAVTFTVAEHPYSGDLYLPDSAPRAGLLLLPGAAQEGKDDPRLVTFAQILARARFAVLVPDLPSFRSLQVHAGNVSEVAEAFRWFSAQTDLFQGPAGLAAFSYAAGPAILAALEPEVRPHADFILAVGPYYDLPAVLTFFTTGWFRLHGEWKYLEPNAYGKWVFVLSNLERIPPEDREIVRLMARRMTDDLEAEVSDLVQRLSPAGRDLYHFVVNTDPKAVPSLMARLPAGILADIAALDLANKDLSPLAAHLIVVHGYDDAIIPYAQSLALKGALPEGEADLFLVHGLQHVDLQPGVRDAWRLWRAVVTLLKARDGIINPDHH